VYGEVAMNHYSRPLQRRMVDFGIDESFEGAHNKMVEHYGIDIPISGIRKATLKHANNVRELQIKQLAYVKEVYSPIDIHVLETGKNNIIVEADGTMIPIVDTSGEKSDKRKNRKISYKEARVSLAYTPGNVDPIFSAGMSTVEETGKRLRFCAMAVGLGRNTFVHGIGDGAVWIVNQIEAKFGDLKHDYLIDMFHLKEYLNAASKAIFPTVEEQTSWVNMQTEHLKSSEITKVLHNIKQYCENSETPEPIVECYKYIDNRQNQLDYKLAIENDLPIGSGKIESAHRYVAQERLKIPGAAWIEDNANVILALRTSRQNSRWDAYWARK
jgi:hypothetical protein